MHAKFYCRAASENVEHIKWASFVGLYLPSLSPIPIPQHDYIGRDRKIND